MMPPTATAEPTVMFHRGRRLRRTPALRSLVRETRLEPAMLVAPIFVRTGVGVREPISSMPGQYRLSPDEVVPEVVRLLSDGVRSVLLFGLPSTKDDLGSGAWDPGGPVPAAIRAVRSAVGDEVAIGADVCLCEYTSHGHCGTLRDASVDTDATLPLLADAAVMLAEAGADIVAPSAMMDGQVTVIRSALDAASQAQTVILAYAAKHASAFYGPFRVAADSAPAFGDRRSYQMDPANGREAIREVLADVAEGADMVMIKPALPALDLVAATRAAVAVPVAAYQVSGEYAAIVAAAERGWLDRRAAALESLTAIARAGASIVVTYFAAEAAGWLSEQRDR
jgi:porphobilinogen synthase